MAAFVSHALTLRSSFCSTPTLKCSRPPVKQYSTICAVSSKPVKSAKNETKHKATEPPPVDWMQQWYPVTTEKDVPVDEPYAFQLFDSKLVLFKVAEGRWSVVDDICSHRLAPLSEGRIVRDTPTSDAEIECPYHGWRFNGCGECSRIPQLENSARIPRRAHIGGYATKVHEGIVFCFLGDRELSNNVPIFVPDEVKCMSDKVQTLTFSRDVKCGFETLVENVLDQEHVHYLHNKVLPLFSRSKGGTSSMKVSFGEGGLRSEGTFSTGKEQIDFGVPNPTTCYLVSDSDGLFTNCLTFFFRPSTRSTTRMFIIQKQDNFKNPLMRIAFSLKPNWMKYLDLLTVTDGDHLVLAHVEDNTGDAANWKTKWVAIPNRMDSLLIAYRTWMDKVRDSVPWLTTELKRSPESLPQSREERLDRWHSHTKHSKESLDAWKTFKMISRVSDVVAKLAVVALIVIFTPFYLESPSVVQLDHLRTVGTSVIIALVSALFLKLQCDRQASRFVSSDEARRNILAD